MAGIQHLLFGALVMLVYIIATSKAAPFTPILPPSYPLAVRNPYLSAWIPGNQVATLPKNSAQFWVGNNLTWSVIARINGAVYNLFGVPSPAANTTSATVVSGTYTSTHSIFVLSAGNVEFTLDFFSPVAFTDYTRQSLPFSYLTVAASGGGGGGQAPAVQVYSDIDDTWTGQSKDTTWSYSTTGSTSVYQLQANGAAKFSEANDMALWGEAVYASRTAVVAGSSLSAASGPPATVRGQFYREGRLGGSHAVWSSGGVVGFAHDLGRVTEEKTRVRFAIGYVREDAVDYIGTAQAHYYRATYADTLSAVSHFLDDYDAAASEAQALDATVATTGASVGGQNYSDILSLSVRQILGGMDVTIPADSLDTRQLKVFVKELSSNGNLNTVDIIFPTFPFFYIFAPAYIRLLLEPVVQYLATGRFPEPYVVHDLGAHYPNATGHDDGTSDEKMPVEETGNLLILAAAYQAATGDTAWAAEHAAMFAGYANYLAHNGLYPALQLSTNDGLGAFANMTNLGVKAAVGLGAYAQLVGGNKTYASLAKTFEDTIYTDGVGVRVALGTPTSGETYFTLTYGSTTWFLLFNLYADQFLGLGLFPQAAFEGQSNFYPTVRGPAGVPMDGNVQWGKTDWQMWVAAIADKPTQDLFVGDLHAFMANGRNTAPFGDRYWASGNSAGLTAEGFRARPTLGGHFAIWALQVAAERRKQVTERRANDCETNYCGMLHTLARA